MNNAARDIANVEPRDATPAQSGESVAMLSMIERAARDPNVDVDKFERLMLMKERVEKEAARKAFNAAVSIAKSDIPPILKNRVVDFTTQKGRTNYRYEDFAAVAKVVDPILKRNGLHYRFRSSQNGQRLAVTCILSHDGGYFEETTLEAPEDHSGNKNAIQAIGSAATYLQRMTLKLALGLATSIDDDGAGSAPPRDAAYLREEGERVAREEGMAALGMWWTKTLTPADRKTLGPETLTALKKTAEQS